jgi:competence protein ComEA
MSRYDGSGTPSIAVDVRRSHHGLVLPWAWSDGARVLLAVLAVLAAVGMFLGSPEPPSAGVPKPSTPADLVLDPNTASAQALEALPHLGPTLARRIAEARADGPFRSLEDVRARVRGIGPATLAQIAPYLRIESAPEIRREVKPEAIAIADSSVTPSAPPGRTSRKPPRSRTRKTKSSSVALAVKTGAGASP